MSDLRTASPKAWPALLRARDLEGIFGFSLRTAQRRINTGAFGPFTTLGGVRYVFRDDLLKILKAGRTDPPPPTPHRRYP